MGFGINVYSTMGRVQAVGFCVNGRLFQWVRFINDNELNSHTKLSDSFFIAYAIWVLPLGDSRMFQNAYVKERY